MSSSSSAKVILFKLVQNMEAKFMGSPSPLLSLCRAVRAHSDFWEACSDPSWLSTSPSSVLGAGAGAADERTGANYQQ